MAQRHNKPPPVMVNMLQILIGIGALLAGASIYMLYRPPDQIFFLREFHIPTGRFQSPSALLCLAGNSLPSFCHVFSFILITSGLLGRSGKSALVICPLWLLIEISFELGQKYQEPSIAISQRLLHQTPWLNPVNNFFLYGTYDVLDLGAVVLGTAAACLVLIFTIKRKSDEDQKNN